MAQLVVGCPLGEPDLRDEIGPGPVRGLIGLDPFGERRRRHFARLQELRHPRELFLIEAGARMSRRTSAAVLLDAEQQRAEVLPRLARLGPAADDEFLFW